MEDKIRLLLVSRVRSGHLEEADVAIINKAIEEAKIQGMREVVEFRQEHNTTLGRGLHLEKEDWQTLKDWAINETTTSRV